MKYLVTGHLDNKERNELEEKGLYCYDLRHSDFGGDIACIEKSVLVNRCGSMITDEKIPLGDKYPDDFVDYETFIKNNQAVDKIEELLSSKTKEDKLKLDFIDDKEKMRDFFKLSKKEFLNSYSYLTEEEYDSTKERVEEKQKKRKNKAKER